MINEHLEQNSFIRSRIVEGYISGIIDISSNKFEYRVFTPSYNYKTSWEATPHIIEHYNLVIFNKSDTGYYELL